MMVLPNGAIGRKSAHLSNRQPRLHAVVKPRTLLPLHDNRVHLLALASRAHLPDGLHAMLGDQRDIWTKVNVTLSNTFLHGLFVKDFFPYSPSAETLVHRLSIRCSFFPLGGEGEMFNSYLYVA